jgi:hypothetical protein
MFDQEPPPAYSSKDPHPLPKYSFMEEDPKRLCKICLERKIDVILLECGHLVACNECASSLKDCPLCREPIQRVKRAYEA